MQTLPKSAGKKALIRDSQALCVLPIMNFLRVTNACLSSGVDTLLFVVVVDALLVAQRQFGRRSNESVLPEPSQPMKAGPFSCPAFCILGFCPLYVLIRQLLPLEPYRSD